MHCAVRVVFAVTIHTDFASVVFAISISLPVSPYVVTGKRIFLTLRDGKFAENVTVSYNPYVRT